VVHDRITCVARHVERFRGRPPRLERLNELSTPHSRQHDIRDDQVDVPRVRLYYKSFEERDARKLSSSNWYAPTGVSKTPRPRLNRHTCSLSNEMELITSSTRHPWGSPPCSQGTVEGGHFLGGRVAPHPRIESGEGRAGRIPHLLGIEAAIAAGRRAGEHLVEPGLNYTGKPLTV